jgi:hypothetical protein
MSKKQTAVEWLEDNLKSILIASINYDDHKLVEYIIPMRHKDTLKELFANAKEMEHHQMLDLYVKDKHKKIGDLGGVRFTAPKMLTAVDWLFMVLTEDNKEHKKIFEDYLIIAKKLEKQHLFDFYIAGMKCDSEKGASSFDKYMQEYYGESNDS